MTKENLPTFRKWGAKLLARKRAIIVALTVVAVHYAGTDYLKRYYAVIEPCDQPCQDAISCDPLEFTFEVIPAKIKLGQPYYLWYRARLKNRTCRRLALYSIDGFLDSRQLRKNASGLWVAVIGPNGREIERLPVPGPDGGISWDYGSSRGVDISTEGTIHPYQSNFGLIKQLKESGKLQESGSVRLLPGETVETIEPKLKPYRIVATSFTTEDGGIGDGYRWVNVPNPPDFPSPPRGFNLLDRYSFSRPGRYTIHAGFEDEIAVYPIFARWEKRRKWLDFLFWPTHPARFNSKKRNVNLLATPVIVEAVK